MKLNLTLLQKNGKNVEATFDVVKRIVWLVAFDIVALIAGVDTALWAYFDGRTNSSVAIIPVSSWQLSPPIKNRESVGAKLSWQQLSHLS